MNAREREPWIRPFVAELYSLLGNEHLPADVATMVKLRRGLTEDTGNRDVWVYGHLHGAAPDDVDLAALVASLFALWHQGGRGSCPATSFGGSFGRLRTVSTDKRFANLLNSHPDDLEFRLRHAVNQLRSKDIPINWERLLEDLLEWDIWTRTVQRRWAHDYWIGRARTEEPERT